MKLKLLTLTAALMLTGAVASATPAGFYPGVYQQFYTDGRLKSVVTIKGNIAGAGEYGTAKNIGALDYVCLDALDNNGYILEAIAGEMADRDSKSAVIKSNMAIDKTNLAKCAKGLRFSADTNKRNKAIITFPQKDMLRVEGAGALYDGIYHFSPRSSIQANQALMLYGYERSKNPEIFLGKASPAKEYTLQEHRKAPWYNTVCYYRIDGNEDKIVADNRFMLIMENLESERAYKPFFMADNFAGWVEGQGDIYLLKEDIDSDFSAIYTMAYLAKQHPAIVENNSVKLCVTDFFGGEGENAIYTKLYSLKYYAKNREFLGGSIGHSDNGQMRGTVYTGTDCIIGDDVRVRQAPNTNANILGYLNKGDLVDVLGLVDETGKEYSNNWVAIFREDGSIGYVYSQFVKRARQD